MQYSYVNLLISTLMTRAMLTTIGLARMGSVIKPSRTKVIIGFTNGIAVLTEDVAANLDEALQRARQLQ